MKKNPEDRVEKAGPLAAIAEQLCTDLRGLEFSAPVTHVYNPLEYARDAHKMYLERFGSKPKEVVFLGMNPGPWGMAQTGVPFGEIGAVRDWLGIEASVERPEREHPARPITGFDCHRSEVSGSRLWGWARERYVTPDRFFRRFFVANYCPLMFLEESGRNRTPDRLPVAERKPLLAACDRALLQLVDALKPVWVVGVGRFAESRARAALDGVEVRIGRMLHPSPASPIANRGWAEQAERDLVELGIRL